MPATEQECREIINEAVEYVKELVKDTNTFGFEGTILDTIDKNKEKVADKICEGRKDSEPSKPKSLESKPSNIKSFKSLEKSTLSREDVIEVITTYREQIADLVRST